jgi:hypothetical protein
LHPFPYISHHDIIETMGSRMPKNQAELSAGPRQRTKGVCNICGKPSETTICETSSERQRLDALARKKHEEQGNAWSHWD